MFIIDRYSEIQLTLTPQSITALTGGELESLMQVIEVCLMGLILDEEQECLEVHIDIIRILQGQHFTDSTLAMLMLKICWWKGEMVRLYGDVTEKRRTAGKRRRNDDNGIDSESEMVKVSFAFPNFEMCEHWAELIWFLGPPKFQDTKLWEQRHLAAKRMCTRTNQRNITQDVLVKVRTNPFSHIVFFKKKKKSCALMCGCADAQERCCPSTT